MSTPTVSAAVRVFAAGLRFVLAGLALEVCSEPSLAQVAATAGAAAGTAPADTELRVGGLRVAPHAVARSDAIGEGASVGVGTGGVPAASSGGLGAGELVIAPVPGYQPVMGATLLLGVAKIYRPAGTDKTSPSWISGGGAFAARNGSWGLGLGHKMNLDDDRWRMTGALAFADIKYRYYGIGNDEGDLDRYTPIKQRAPAGMAKVMYRVGGGWYVGANIVVADSTLRLDPEDLPPGLELPPGWEDSSEPVEALLAGVTPTIEYDTRDNEFFPRRGILFSAEAALFSDSLGSDFNFQVYTLAYNHFFSMGERGVLAVRAYGRVAQGDVPFFALSTLGQGSDIRGYTPGRYRDNALVAAQVEYRYELSAKWCVAAFAGVGAVGPSLGDIPRGLPAGGVGARYRLAEKSKVSLRMDVAWGRDDSAIYLSVGEAF